MGLLIDTETFGDVGVYGFVCESDALQDRGLVQSLSYRTHCRLSLQIR